MGKVQFPFFMSSWLLLQTLSFWKEDWTLVYNSSKFWDFPDISFFSKIQSLKSLDNFWGNLYIPCFLLIIAFRFTCGERKIWQNIKKSQNITKLLSTKFSFAFTALINNSNSYKHSYLVWNLLYLSKKLPKTNLKIFKYQISTSVKRSEK